MAAAAWPRCPAGPKTGGVAGRCVTDARGRGRCTRSPVGCGSLERRSPEEEFSRGVMAEPPDALRTRAAFRWGMGKPATSEGGFRNQNAARCRGSIAEATRARGEAERGGKDATSEGGLRNEDSGVVAPCESQVVFAAKCEGTSTNASGEHGTWPARAGS